MNEEDEAFEDLAKRQGDWGMQGSRKHQILRYAENVEPKENMNKPITSKKFASDLWGVIQMAIEEAVLAEREACAKLIEDLPAPDEYSDTDKSMWDVTCMDCADAIRARGQASDKAIAQRIVPLYTISPQRTEQNFCPRCGKRTPDLTHIHTCTPPPQENT